MPTSYALTLTASDLTSQGSLNNLKALPAPDASGTQGNMTLSGGQTQSVAMYTEPNVPGLTEWPAGDYTHSCDIDATGADITYTFSIRRVNSSGVLQQTLGTSSAQSGTGTKAFTVNVGSPIATNAGDRLVGVLTGTRGASHGNQTLTASFNGTFDLLIGAWSESNPVTVTPSTASLTTATFAPTVTASNHKTVTPTTAALSLSMFAPTVTVAATGVTVTPTTASLTTALFAPTVTASNHQTVTPTIAALSTTSFAPSVVVSDHKTVIPSKTDLALSLFAPTVTTTANQLVTPATASLLLSTFAPTVTGGSGLTLIPSTKALATTLFAPTVLITEHKLVVPTIATLSLNTFIPTVTASSSSTYSSGCWARNSGI